MSLPQSPLAEITDRNPVLPPEVIVVDGHKVACDGGGGALGHPKVWYEMGGNDVVECKYCDRRFIRAGSVLDPTRKG